MGYRVGSFNLHNLGKNSLTKTSIRSINTIAKIIGCAGMDIVALQEVLSNGDALSGCAVPDTVRTSFRNGLIDELRGITGCEWDFAWADASNDVLGEARHGDLRGEGYAFVWNTNRIELCRTWVSGNDSNYGGYYRNFYPQMCYVNKESMFRRPYYGRFKIKSLNVEIRLICIHTYYGDDSKESRAKRRHELDVLLKDIYPQIEDRRYGTFMRSYTIMLGDYNAELWNSESNVWQHKLKMKRGEKIPAVIESGIDMDGVVKSQMYGGHRVKTVQTGLTTIKQKPLEDEGPETAGFNYNYDHASYEQERFDDISVSCRRLPEVVSKYCKTNMNEKYLNEYDQYFQTVSDHIPIIFEMNFK